MSLVLNTNISSLTAQHNLTKSQSTLSTAMERLSSGLRINHASDDAAGMAISSRMTTQINGLDQAARNANDGISLAQTAEGALTELTSNLQRIRELAVQAANSTNSDSDRATLDQEVQQRLAEVNRIATTTSFNGRKVLDGSFGSASFQVGANVGETIGISLNTSMKTKDIGSLATAASGSTSGLFDSVTLASGDLTVKLGSGTAVNVAAGTYTSATDLATAINTAAATAGFGANVATVVSGEIKLTNNETTSGNTLTMGGTGATALGIATTAVAISGGTTTSTAVASSLDGLTLATGALTLAVGSGSAVDLAGSYATAQDLADAINSKVSGANATIDSSGKLSIAATEDLTIGGTNTSLGFTAGTTVVDSSGLSNVDVLTADDANDAIQRIDAALTAVNNLDSTLGAIQNRFQSAINSDSTTSENLTAARSRIQDADFASETSKMTSANILQQAGVSVLSQANSSQQSILKLLQ